MVYVAEVRIMWRTEIYKQNRTWSYQDNLFGRFRLEFGRQGTV